MSSNGKFPKIKFKSTSIDSGMGEAMTDESDVQDDAEFSEEHEKYSERCQRHDLEILKAEEERQNVLPQYLFYLRYFFG